MRFAGIVEELGMQENLGRAQDVNIVLARMVKLRLHSPKLFENQAFAAWVKNPPYMP